MKCQVVLNAMKDKYSRIGEKVSAGGEGAISDKVTEGLRVTFDYRNECSQGAGQSVVSFPWGETVPGGRTANAKVVFCRFKD